MDWFLCDNGLRHERVNRVCDHTIFEIVTDPKDMDQRTFKRYYLWSHFHEKYLKNILLFSLCSALVKVT